MIKVWLKLEANAVTGWVYTENPPVGLVAFTARSLAAHICLLQLLWLCLRYKLMLKLSSCTKKPAKNRGENRPWGDLESLAWVCSKPTPLKPSICQMPRRHIPVTSQPWRASATEERLDRNSSDLSREYQTAPHSLKPSAKAPRKVNCLGGWWDDSVCKDTCFKD